VTGSAILITGASRGIGAAVARELAAPDRTIGVNYLSSVDAAKTVARDVEAAGAKALLLPADVTSAPAVDALFETFLRETSRLDALVLNAGTPYRYARLAETTVEEFERQWRAQVQSAVLCCRRAAPVMLKQKSGSIAFVLSEAAQGAPPAFMAPYVSAKYAALGLAKALESELSPRGVRVRCVFPPMTETDFIKDFPRPLVDAAREARPDKRLASPREAARSVARALGLAKRGAGKS